MVLRISLRPHFIFGPTNVQSICALCLAEPDEEALKRIFLSTEKLFSFIFPYAKCPHYFCCVVSGDESRVRPKKVSSFALNRLACFQCIQERAIFFFTKQCGRIYFSMIHLCFLYLARATRARCALNYFAVLVACVESMAHALR